MRASLRVPRAAEAKNQSAFNSGFPRALLTPSSSQQGLSVLVVGETAPLVLSTPGLYAPAPARWAARSLKIVPRTPLVAAGCVWQLSPSTPELSSN